MTDPSLTSLPTLDEPGDAELISAVRAGDLEAYGTLFERHVDAARRLARQLVSAGDVDDLVSDAFSKVLGVLQRGGGPDLAFRAYLLTSLRRLHVDKIRATSRLTTTDDLTPYDPGVPFEDTAVSGFDNAAAAKAFAALPERWQQVLWHTEVEGQKPAEIAPLLGMSPNSVSALAYRAREGLRQAFISMHAQEALDDACARTRANLGAYIRGGLSKRDSAKVDAHLQDCRECTAIYLELTEVNSNLGALLAPLLLGTAGAGYLAAAATGTKAGFLLFLSGAKGWILHNPVGRVTAGATGVAAAAVVVAAVAMSGGDHNPPPAAAPKPSTPASAPAANPPTSNPAPKTTTKKSSPPVAPPATTAPAAPPATPPSSTPPATPPEQAPVIATPLPAVNVTPGKSVVIDLTNGATDPNGDPLTVKSASVAKPSHGTVRKGGTKARPVMPRLSGGKTGVSGSAPILARSAGGPTTVIYTPDPGWRGTDTIRYTLTDGHGGEVSGSVKVTTPNADPVARSFTVTTKPGLQSVFATWIWPLRHASDSNHDTLRLSFTQPTNGGRVTVGPDGDGKLEYHRTSGFSAYTDRFTYTVADGHGGRDTATVTVRVNGGQPTPPPVNYAPVAVDDHFDELPTDWDDQPTTPLDVVANDFDRNGDHLTVTRAWGAEHGTVTATKSGEVLYTPDSGYPDKNVNDPTDSFSYAISDGNGGRSQAHVFVTLKALPNRAPEAGNDAKSTGFGEPVDIDVLDNDSDADGDSLSIKDDGDPPHGTTTTTLSGAIHYVPDIGFSGTDTFTYTVTDGEQDASGTVTVTVGEPPLSAGGASRSSSSTRSSSQPEQDDPSSPTDAGGATSSNRGSGSGSTDDTTTDSPDDSSLISKIVGALL